MVGVHYEGMGSTAGVGAGCRVLPNTGSWFRFDAQSNQTFYSFRVDESAKDTRGAVAESPADNGV